MKYDTIKEATQAWVREFNAIPSSILEKLLKISLDELQEITPPAVGNRVYVYDPPAGENEGEIIQREDDLYTIELDDGATCVLEPGEFDVQRDGYLPVWGTLWAFGDSVDNWWLEKHDGLQIMADCGFRIYEQEDYEYVFGIDGAGYDFYSDHWIPLYKARGLHWHKEEE